MRAFKGLFDLRFLKVLFGSSVGCIQVGCIGIFWCIGYSAWLYVVGISNRGVIGLDNLCAVWINNLLTIGIGNLCLRCDAGSVDKRT